MQDEIEEIKNFIAQDYHKDHFEMEKAEFLQAIQENMQILDTMLKQYAIKSQQQMILGPTSQQSNSTAQ
jgi:hypothetical protein